MRTLPMLTLLALAACTDKPAPADTDSGAEDTGPATDSGDTGDTADTADTAETGETGETGETADPVIDNDDDGSPVEEDCDDADPLIHPGAVDAICDGIDADCDGIGLDDAFLIGETRHADLGAALAAAVDGDTIDVCPGIWVGNHTISTPMRLTLRGASGDNTDTELDGGSLAPVLVVGAGVDLTIEDLGIINGVAQWRDDTYRQSGGGVYAEDARITLRRARFADNTAQDQGGGLAIVLGAGTTSGLWVEDSHFEDNRASDHGGAVAVFGQGDAEVSIATSTFTLNRAPIAGAALYFEGAPVSATVSDCTFTTNDASGARSYGGAIGAAGEEVRLTVTDSTFSGNTAGNSAGALSMTADRSELVVDTSVFSSNTATEGGGAVRVTTDDMDVAFRSCAFDGNLASTQGGAVELDGAGYGFFDSVVASDNSAGNAGGAYYFDGGDGLYLEVTIGGGAVTTNRAGLGGGGGVYATGARVVVSSVDFGSFSSTNTPQDVYGCAGDFEAGASFIYDPSSGEICE